MNMKNQKKSLVMHKVSAEGSSSVWQVGYVKKYI